MNFKSIKGLSLFLLIAHVFLAQGQTETISSLKFLGEYDIPNNKPFKNTTIGGLSGIDYDSENQIYYLISDDRSTINPARYYTAKLFFTDKGVDSVQFINVYYLRQQDGSLYPGFKADPLHAPDPESIRYNPKASELVWSSEGEKTKEQEKTILQDPAIIISNLDGNHQRIFPLAPNKSMYEIEKGSRQNGALEGISFSNDYKILYASMEEPLYEDGPRADVFSNNAIVRIYKYDYNEKKNIAQYGYLLETVAFAPSPSTGFKVNGISEILALAENKLLVVERSFSWGRLACTVKVFMADLSKASNIANVNSLKENPPAQLIQKKLLLNMDSLGIYIDNVEGVTFGPKLQNGHQTLLFVTDNNFSPLEKTQFLLFEVIP